MIPQTLREHYLVDELQLGQTLNQAISQGRRSEFSLLLAMLSPDVEDQPWVADAPAIEAATIDWRRRFELPKARPLAAEPSSHARALRVSELVAGGSLLSAHLLDCLEPEPLVPPIRVERLIRRTMRTTRATRITPNSALVNRQPTPV